MEQKITRERLLAIIAAYGDDPARWPGEERGAALALLAQSGDDPGIVTAREEAGAVDGWLALIETPALSPGLRERVLQAPRSAQSREWFARLLHWLFPDHLASPAWVWRPALAATLPLLAGVLLGIGTASGTTPEETSLWEEEIYLSGILAIESDIELLANEFAEIQEEKP